MKSFYQFYESVSSKKKRYNEKGYVVYSKLNYYSHYHNQRIVINNVYEDENEANIALKALNVNSLMQSTLSFSFGIDIDGPTPFDGDPVYLILFTDKDGYKGIGKYIYVYKSEANADAKGYPAAVVHQTTFIAKLKYPKPSSIPKSLYANLKYPLIGELTHYLTGLNQEIYQIMRDKSQKSINLLNTLKTLIKKIELA